MATTDSVKGDYFTSYGDLSVHELMLKDRPRTLAYRSFFETNRELIKDKIVMDVGAGTGILSLFAAAAGARKVFAVEASSVATLCEEIVKENDYESIIQVIHGAVEDITLPGDIQKVDVIISEWMGFYLLHESMLDSVIVARDRFLAPDGILAPSHATLYFSPVDMSEHFVDRAEEWSNIYGFDFSPIASQLNMEEVSKPLIKTLKPETLRAEAQRVLELDLRTVTVEDVKKFTTVLKFPLSQDSKVFGFAAWFDVQFSAENLQVAKGNSDGLHKVSDDGSIGKEPPSINEKGDASVSVSSSANVGAEESSKGNGGPSSNGGHKASIVTLKTGPSDPPTHWKQTVVFLPRTIMVEKGITLCCRVKMAQDSENKRHYNITVMLVDENDPDEDDEDDDECESGDESDASTDHPVPCQCGSDRCRLIAALVEKYGEEHEELGQEAQMVEVEAEMEAARQLDADIEREGWPMDSSTSAVSTEESGDVGQKEDKVS